MKKIGEPLAGFGAAWGKLCIFSIIPAFGLGLILWALGFSSGLWSLIGMSLFFWLAMAMFNLLGALLLISQRE